MWTFTTIRDHAARPGQGAARMFAVVQQQPSWIMRVAFTIGLATFTGVVLLLVVPALLIAAIAFFLLLWAYRVWMWVRSRSGLDRSGRRNVRVIVRE